MSSRTDKEKYWRLYKELLKAKGRLFYMKYARILVLALIEIIAEMYNKQKEKK